MSECSEDEEKELFSKSLQTHHLRLDKYASYNPFVPPEQQPILIEEESGKRDSFVNVKISATSKQLTPSEK